jgi:hypothetical protein
MVGRIVASERTESAQKNRGIRHAGLPNAGELGLSVESAPYLQGEFDAGRPVICRRCGQKMTLTGERLICGCPERRGGGWLGEAVISEIV